MKTPVFLAGAAVLALSLSSCHLKEKYAARDKATVAYLAGSKKAPAKINVEGLYYSPDWGLVALDQTAGKVGGYFYRYSVDGVVSGRQASLVLYGDTWSYYTVELTRVSGTGDLEGFYSSSIPFDEKDKQPILLKKIDL